MKNNNWTIISKKVDRHLGELVLNCIGEVVLLIGLEDRPDDYYYIFLDRDCKSSLDSCVGGFIPLKGCISDRDYEQLAYIFHANYILPKLKYFKWIENIMDKKISPQNAGWKKLIAEVDISPIISHKYNKIF